MKTERALILSLITIAGMAAIIGTIAIRRNTAVLEDLDQVLMENTYNINKPQAAREITYHTDRIRSALADIVSDIIDHTPIREQEAKQAIGNSIEKLERINVLWASTIKFEHEVALNKKEPQRKLKAFEALKSKIETLVFLVNKTVIVRSEEGSQTASALFTTEVEPLLREIAPMADEIEIDPTSRMAAEARTVKEALRYSVLVSIILIGVAFVAVVAICYCFVEAVPYFLSRSRKVFQDIEENRPSKPAKNAAKCLSETSTNYGENAAFGPHDESDSSLQLRVRQLNCFYGLSSLAERPNMSLQEILAESTEVIRNAYQNPDVTCVRIKFDGVQYKTDNFEKSETSQCTPINARGNATGSVEIYYIGEKTQSNESPFLTEEREMLDAVGNQLSRIAGVRQYREKLQLFRSLIDHSNDCIFVLDSKWGRILDTNERACERLGYKRKDLLDMTVKDIDELVDEEASWDEHLQQLTSDKDVIIQSMHRRHHRAQTGRGETGTTHQGTQDDQ